MKRHLAPLAAALVLAACGGDSTPAGAGAPSSVATDAVADDDATSEESASSDPAPDPAASPPSDVVATPASLSWSGTDLQGDPVDGGSFAGEDLVLWVWAPWCSICNREAPDVAGVAAARTDVRFVGIAGKDDLPQHRAFVDEHDLGFFDHVADVDGSIWSHYGVGYQPAFVFITAEGEITDVHAGAMDPADLNAAIDDLVAA